MENYFKDLQEQVRYAKNNSALDEIKKIGKRKLLSIVSDSNIKTSIKSSSKKQYKTLIKNIKIRRKKIN